MRTIRIYNTDAECYRDVHEVYSAILDQTGMRIAPDVKQYDEGCNVQFIVHDRCADKVNAETINNAIFSVSDAQDMAEFMVEETYELAEDITWYEYNTIEKIRNNGKLVSKQYFCKMFDNVFDVIAEGVWNPEKEVA
tara:strand:+ start:816 stop:1226 length:411 start_codon:yes stop_codon:yes gene_type:complete